MNKDRLLKIIGIILYATAFFTMVAYLVTLGGNDIWYDEVFSVVFSSSSYREIIRLTSADVHPPLYYFYLKAFTDIGRAVFAGTGIIFWAKLASFVPWGVMFILAVFPIRKRFGIFTGGFFALLITVMPKLGANYAEIRMYSFAMMLITIAFVCTLGLMSDKKTGLWGVGFCIAGIATAYTQYYACIAIIGLYICFGIYAVISGKKRQLRRLIFSAGLSVIAYLPWTGPLLSQMRAVSDNYWILPLTLRSIPGCLKFLFLPSDTIGIRGYVCACIVMAVIALVYVLFFVRKPGKDELYIALAGPSVLAFTVLTGFILSITGRPIFVYRYMIPVMGAFYLSTAYVFGNVAKDNLRILITLLVFIFSARITVGGYYYEEKQKCDKMTEAGAVLDEIPDDAIIITNFDHVCTLMSYYLPDNKIYLYEGRPDAIVELMYNRSDFEINEDKLKDLVKGDAPLYFFGSFNSREDLLSDWEKIGIENTEETDSVLIERYYFNIYRLTR